MYDESQRYILVVGDTHTNVVETRRVLDRLTPKVPNKDDRYHGGDGIGYGITRIVDGQPVESGLAAKDMVDLLREHFHDDHTNLGNHPAFFLGLLPMINMRIAADAIKAFKMYMRDWVGIEDAGLDEKQARRFLARVFPNPYTGEDPLEDLKKQKESYNRGIGVVGRVMAVAKDEAVEVGGISELLKASEDETRALIEKRVADGNMKRIDIAGKELYSVPDVVGLLQSRGKETDELEVHDKHSGAMEVTPESALNTPGFDEKYEGVKRCQAEIDKIQAIRESWVAPDGKPYWEYFAGMPTKICFEIEREGKESVPVTIVHSNPLCTDPRNIEWQKYVAPRSTIGKLRKRFARDIMREKVAESEQGLHFKTRMENYIIAESLVNRDWLVDTVDGEWRGGIWIFNHFHHPYKRTGVVNGKEVVVASPGSIGRNRFAQKEDGSLDPEKRSSALVIDKNAGTLDKMVQVIYVK